MKKLLAVLLVMAMVLGMGVVASADATTEATAVLKVADVEEFKAGETATISVVTSAKCMMSAFEFRVAWDTEKFELATQADEYGEYAQFGDAFLTGYVGGSMVNNKDSENTFFFSGANSSKKYSTVEAGVVIGTIDLKAKADVAVDDVVATLKVSFVTNDQESADYMKNMDVEVKAIEKVTTTAAPETTTAAAETTAAATTAAATTAAAETTAAATTTVKKVETKDEAIAAITDLSQAVAAGKKLTKDSFASAADYEAFAAAYAAAEKVLANKNATAEEKAAALATLKAALAKAKDAAIIDAVNSEVIAPATTTKKTSNGKTGDASNAAALMIVAMVAFGTAVVVYRKKVNA